MKYALYDGKVLVGGRANLSYKEVSEFMYLAVRRRIRVRGQVELALAQLRRTGYTTYSWEFLAPHLYGKWSRGVLHHAVTVTIEQAEGGFLLTCTNGKDRAPRFVIERVNGLLREQLLELRRVAPKKTKRGSNEKRKKRKARRAKKLRMGEHQPKQARTTHVERREKKAPPRPKKRPLERVAVEELLQTSERAQFRSQYVSWAEAVKATVAIFEVKATSYQTRAQIVARAFYTSFESSGGEYVEYAYCGFTLRFRLIDQVCGLSGDTTPFTILAAKQRKGVKMSKDKKRIYERMRKYFRTLFGGLTIIDRQVRTYALLKALAANDDEATGTQDARYQIAC